jgi:hypothetical protein
VFFGQGSDELTENFLKELPSGLVNDDAFYIFMERMLLDSFPNTPSNKGVKRAKYSLWSSSRGGL